ncbi:hypothetical protein [Paeniglutamicibacter antarcticus]|uniref:DUF2339 domain-containing protein n=1 Tax=Paeniglutamicibacter antarcticus TaxID=494023 RepID=A0ABP9TRY4_9MICC
MSESSVTLLVIVIFIAGIFLGRYVASRKSREPGSARNPEADRTALAKAWQSGFAAGTQEAARNADALQVGIPGTVRFESAHPEAGARAVNPPPEPIDNSSGFQPAASGVAPRQHQDRSPAWMAADGSPTPVPPARAVPVDPRVRALRNINITLYVAALLMVAASSLFIALALPATAKVVGLGIVTAGFYIIGLVMHARSERLRPAAAAFAATGLALIPMTGLAHYILLSTTPGTSWFVTSLVGTAAFIYAAGKLQSRIVASLAITFLISTAYAGGAVLNRGLVYYFLFSMLLATAISLVGFKKPRWVTNIYVQSFSAAHRYLVPATLAASIFSIAVLEAKDYAWLFAAAATYYAVAVLSAPAAERFVQLAAARVSGMISIGTFLHVAEVPLTDIFRILALILLLQLVALAQYAAGYGKRLGLKEGIVKTEAWVLLAAASLSTVLGAEGLLHDPFMTGGGSKLDLNWSLALLLVAGIFLAAKEAGNFLWAPLGIALLGLFEPMGGNLGRQSLVMAVAVIATWLLSRTSTGVPALLLRWAARIGSVLAIGDMFSFAASDWVLKARGGGGPTRMSSAESQHSLVLGGVVEIATLTGVVLAVLAQLVIAAVVLRGLQGPGAGSAEAGLRRFKELGESLIFACGVLCAATLTWLLGSSSAGMRGTLGDVDASSSGWSTVLWLGYQWDTILLWILLLVGLAGATMVLGYRRGQARSSTKATSLSWDLLPMALVHLGGLMALLAALGLAEGKDPAWMVELVAVIGLLHVGIRITAGTEVATRIGYTILAQVLFSGTAWHVADRLDIDGHGQFALFAFTLALPQGLRVLLGRNAPTRKPADPRTALTVLVLVLQLLIPLFYMGVHSGGYDQGSLLVQSMCLLALGGIIARFRGRREALLVYASIPAAIGALGLVLVPALGGELRVGGWLPNPLWDQDVAGILVVLMLIGILVAEQRNLLGRSYRWVRVALGPLYWVALFALHEGFEHGWQLVAGLLGAAGFLVFAATWGIPLLLLASGAFVFFSSLQGLALLHQMAGQRGSEPLDTMLGLGASFIILLIAALFGGRFGTAPTPWALVLQRSEGWSTAHARVLFGSALASLGIGGILGQVHDFGPHVYAGGAMVLVAALAAAALEVPPSWREPGYEVAALVGAAVIQRCWWVGVGEMSGFAVLYYWVITLALLASYEFWRIRERNGTAVLSVSAGLLSVTGVGTIISSSVAQQLVVLLSFTALLVFGLVTNRKIFTIWGAVGVSVAVLWFLRGFTFLLLLLIAVALIVLALWRLGKMNSSSQKPGDFSSGGAPADHLKVPASGAPESDPRCGAMDPGAAQEPRKPSGLPWMKQGGQDPADGQS